MCSDPFAAGKLECTGDTTLSPSALQSANSSISPDFSREFGFSRPRSWDSRVVSFDSFYTAMVALLAGSTMEWSHWARVVSETGGAYAQPRIDASLDSLSVFIFFVPLVWICVYGCMSAVRPRPAPMTFFTPDLHR